MNLDALREHLKPAGNWSAFGDGDGDWWDHVEVPFHVSPDDLLVTVSAGMRWGELQESLRAFGLALPYAAYRPSDQVRIGQLLGANVPHRLESEFRSWRDWVLGATMLLADGTLAKSGARVTKSVAGFDAHQLPIGTLGTLVVPVQLHLRVVSLGRMAWPEPLDLPPAIWYVRDASGLQIVKERPAEPPQEGWWMDEHGVGTFSPMQMEYWQRAKAIFDPEGALPPIPGQEGTP